MEKQIGIWLDHKKAYVISLEESRESVRTIESEFEPRVRIEGEKRVYSGHGTQVFDNEKTKMERQHHQLAHYYEEIISSINGSGEVLLFGPAGAKKELGKELRSRKGATARIRAIKNSGKMTENQMKAFVKEFFTGG